MARTSTGSTRPSGPSHLQINQSAHKMSHIAIDTSQVSIAVKVESGLARALASRRSREPNAQGLEGKICAGPTGRG